MFTARCALRRTSAALRACSKATAAPVPFRQVENKTVTRFLQPAAAFGTKSSVEPKPEVMKNVRLLKSLGASPQEVQSYLNMYLEVDNRRFGVIKVGGGVIQDNLDDLVNSICTLTKFGLIPIVVHGAGPQMNSTLKKMGIPSSYDEGLRITTPEILKVARKIFVEANFTLANALEKKGCRATPIQTGVFEAKPLNMERWGYVGDITHVNIDPVFNALDNGCVPILTCMGQSDDGHFLNINADIAARDIAKVVQPKTVVFVSQKGGLADDDGKIMQSIDINYDYDNLMAKPWYAPGDGLKLKEIKDLMSVLPQTSTVSVTSAALMAKELLTHSLSGTLVTNTERINRYDNLKDIDKERLVRLIEQAFQGKLRDDFLSDVEENVHAIYLSEMYHCTAIITKVDGIPYLSKFAVAEDYQMAGLGRRIFETLKKDFPSLVWRSRTTNEINRWYFQRSQGSFTQDKWTMFWYGLPDFKSAEKLVDTVTKFPKDIVKGEDIPPPLMAELPQAPQQEDVESHPIFKVGLIGARGHTGLELIKLIESHPYMELSVASSRAMVGQPLSALYPETTSSLMFSDVDAKSLPDHNDINLWILAMPNGASKQFVDVIPENVKIVDLSADYRFDSSWQYGLPEKGNNRELIRNSSRVANPGCYATGQQLSLLPLVDPRGDLKPILSGTPHIFGVSGYSGAGTTPSRKNDISCLRDNMMGYSLQGHIHEREVSRQLATLGFENGVRFMPHVAQWFRGIHLTVAVDINGSEGREELIYRYRTFYENEPLVRVTEEYPEVRDIANKHHVEIGAFSVNKEKTRLVLNTTIDNLLKGAATQCMQNMNLMLGLNETESIIPKNPLASETAGSSVGAKE